MSWHVWDARTSYNNKIQPIEGNKYHVKLKDGTECIATFDDYSDTLAIEPAWWVIYPNIDVGGKERTIHYVLGNEVTHWKDS